MPWLAPSVSLLSAGALAYEVLLVRLFSIAQFHHYTYLVISLALLGYGASGTVLTFARGWLLERFDTAFSAGSCLFGLAALACYGLSQRIHFNPLEAAWDPRQFLHLSAVHLLLSVPFLFAASCVGLALARETRTVGRVYRADLLGAGAGAAAVLLALFALRPETCLRLVAGVGFAAGGLCAAGRGRRWRAASLVLAGVVAAALWPRAWLAPAMSEYKGLSQALRIPGAEIVAERSGPLGLLTVVRSPQVPFRQAPGLSLNCSEEPPEQLALFTDGDSLSPVAKVAAQGDSAAYLRCTTAGLPYRLVDRPRVLVLGAGGGSGVLAALANGAAAVDAVEANPQVLKTVRSLGDYTGDLYDRPPVRAYAADPRSFLARSRDRWDVVELTVAGAGRGKSYLLTVEALEEVQRHLTAGGYLSVTLPLTLPPWDALKLVGTAAAAWGHTGVLSPGASLALIRSWDAVTLLARNGELGAREIDRIRAFCEAYWFDLGYYPGMGREEANRYNLLAEPFFFDGVSALLGPGGADFVSRYKLAIDPVSDNRPHFGHFFRPSALRELLSLKGRGGAPLVDWGYLLLVATVAQAAAAGFVLILLPLAALRGARLGGPTTLRVAGYFTLLGLAFLFVEIAFLERLTLFLGQPLYAASTVLAAFLIFAGLGSGWSRRLEGRGAGIGFASSAAAALSLVYLLGLPPLLRLLLPLSDAARLAWAAGLVAPLAFCMGMPFPLGLAQLGDRHPEALPWAWGVNGWASVVSPPLATLLAVHFGYSAVVGSAAALYLAAAWVGRKL